MSHLTLRDLDHDQVLDPAAMHSIKGGYTPLLPQGVSFAEATGAALAIGPNTYAKTDTFAVTVPGASAAGSHSIAMSF